MGETKADIREHVGGVELDYAAPAKLRAGRIIYRRQLINGDEIIPLPDRIVQIDPANPDHIKAIKGIASAL